MRALSRWFPLLSVSALSLAGYACNSAPPAGCDRNSDCAASEVCIDRRCERSIDANRPDAFTALPDVPPPMLPDAYANDANCVRTECGATDACDDGLDNDCDTRVDEGCSCVPGSTTRCLTGEPGASVARCDWGEMTCSDAVEFGSWGACIEGASGMPPSPYGCRRVGIIGAPGSNGSSDFQTWLETQGAIATRIHADAAMPMPLRRAELDTFDLVIIDYVRRAYTMEESQILEDWVRDGGGLVAMTGHDGDSTRHNSLLAALGPSYDNTRLLSGLATLLTHPTTGAADGSVLPPVTFAGGRAVIVPTELATDLVPVAMLGADVVGVAGPMGEGRVFIFGDEWIEFDSEWRTMPAIPRLWQNTVQWGAPDEPLIPACE
jgi:hypothetical protein